MSDKDSLLELWPTMCPLCFQFARDGHDPDCEAISMPLAKEPEYITISREAIDVLLMAAEWAEARMNVPENPLNLAITNFRAELNSATALAASTRKFKDG